MDIIAADLGTATNDTTCGHLPSAKEVGLIQSAGVENLNVETVTLNPVLPSDRKWAIRFKADGTVVIVLGMRDYGRGWFSPYFAGLVTARLGVPFSRVRIYYSATLPAILQTPKPSSIAFHRSHIGPVADAVADIVDGLCDQVVEKGRLAFAAMAGVDTVDVGFDQLAGRFFILDRNRSGNVLEIAEIVRRGTLVLSAFARKLQPGQQREGITA
jgi:CO/xanthine dehydrogenase Mo-binding subunit